MTNIRGDDKSVRSLLGQKYRIDYYQREYKWEKKQIRELIDDLTDRFLLDYQEDHEREAVANYGQYFLGSVIVSERSNDHFIVDGQQRLTSLTLLLIYLDHLQKKDGSILGGGVKIADLIYSEQYGRKSFNLDIPERAACLHKLLIGEFPDSANEPLSVQNMIYRYGEIDEIFPDEIRGQALPFFIDWLMDKVIFVKITAFSDDDAYTIFETMNDRGLSLTPTDMLKGYLLAKIEDDEERNQAGSVWKLQISKLRELGKDEDADCIKAWLRSQYADKIRVRKAGAVPEDFDKLGTEFHRWVREHHRRRVGIESSADFTRFVTENFKFYACAYTRARKAADTYIPEFTSIYFNSQNSFTLQYPLILAPLRLEDDDETVNRKIQLVSNFVEILLARRIWNFKSISHSTMQYRAFLIMKEIRGMSINDLKNKLFQMLSQAWVEGDEYIDFKSGEPFRLHGSNRSQVHRLLARLTEFVEVQSGLPARYPEYANRSSKRGYQIEHIWADRFKDHEEEFSHSSEFATYRNRIGGLLVLPGIFNASYGGNSFEKKLPHYATQNLLAKSLNPIAYENNPGFKRFLSDSKLPFVEMNEFKKAQLDERQDLYNSLADLCWSPDKLKKI